MPILTRISFLVIQSNMSRQYLIGFMFKQELPQSGIKPYRSHGEKIEIGFYRSVQHPDTFHSLRRAERNTSFILPREHSKIHSSSPINHFMRLSHFWKFQHRKLICNHCRMNHTVTSLIPLLKLTRSHPQHFNASERTIISP